MALFEKASTVLPGKTLYFPGCLASAKLPRVVKAQQALLRELGIETIALPELECCGHPAWRAGYRDTFDTIKQRNKEVLKKHRIVKIITGCPHCALTFAKEYGVATEHLLETVGQHLEKVKKADSRTVDYHHPCTLCALNLEQKDAVRVLRRANVHVANETEEQKCCGSVGDDFARNAPEAASVIAASRVKAFKTGVVVTSCPYCNVHLSRHHAKVRDVAEMLNEV